MQGLFSPARPLRLLAVPMKHLKARQATLRFSQWATALKIIEKV